MSGYTSKTERYVVTQEEIERITARARQMRADVLRAGMRRSWGMLPRIVTRNESPPRHA